MSIGKEIYRDRPFLKGAVYDSFVYVLEKDKVDVEFVRKLQKEYVKNIRERIFAKIKETFGKDLQDMGFDHPHDFSVDEIATSMKGGGYRTFGKTNDGRRVTTGADMFTDAMIEKWAAHFVKAFAQAQSNECIVFGRIGHASGIAEIYVDGRKPEVSSGIAFVKGNKICWFLFAYPYKVTTTNSKGTYSVWKLAPETILTNCKQRKDLPTFDEFIKSKNSEKGLSGKISIKSKPSGAKVYINSNFVGMTSGAQSLDLPVQSGKVTIKIEKTGYKTWEETLTVTENANIPIEVELVVK